MNITRLARRLAVVVTGTALLSLTACGDDDSASTGNQSETRKIAITFDGDTVTPNGERVDVGVGQKVELDVTADSAGEIHVHSDPEQELEYDEGSTTLTLDPIDQPGVVDVESHDLEQTIVQLEVK
jgi:hypothetical protein